MYASTVKLTSYRQSRTFLGQIMNEYYTINDNDKDAYGLYTVFLSTCKFSTSYLFGSR